MYFGLPWQCREQESSCYCRGHWFDPWSRKIPPAVEQLSPSTTTAEPTRQDPRAATTEAHVPRAYAFLIPKHSYFPSVAYKDNAKISTHIPKSQQSNLIKVMCRKSYILDRTSEFYVNIVKRMQCGGQGDVPYTTAYKENFLPTILTIRREELFGFSFQHLTSNILVIYIWAFCCIYYLGEEGATEEEMVGWHHQLNGHEFEQTPGDSEGQGSLVCCSPRGCKKSDTTV